MEDCTPRLEIGDVVTDYKITEKLDEGGFGQVFKVVSLKEPQLGSLAMKIESTEQEGGSAIKLENEVMSLLNQLKSYHFPIKYHAARKKKFCYIIMELLGHNLKNLRLQSPGVFASPSTYSRIGVQCLYAIKQLHELGFIHRDVKPGNFVIGAQSSKDPLRSHVVFLLDFGIARPYAVKDASGVLRIRKPRPNAEFRGTMRYCSPNAHEHKDLGRIDDVWGMMYMMLEMLKPLPWTSIIEPIEIQAIKTHMLDLQLVSGGAEHFLPIFEHLRKSNYYSRPNYSMIYDVFANIYRLHSVKMDDPYDWETANLESYIRWKAVKESSPKYPWEDPATFFCSDAYPERTSKDKNALEKQGEMPLQFSLNDERDSKRFKGKNTKRASKPSVNADCKTQKTDGQTEAPGSKEIEDFGDKKSSFVQKSDKVKEKNSRVSKENKRAGTPNKAEMKSKRNEVPNKGEIKPKASATVLALPPSQLPAMKSQITQSKKNFATPPSLETNTKKGKKPSDCHKRTYRVVPKKTDASLHVPPK